MKVYRRNNKIRLIVSSSAFHQLESNWVFDTADQAKKAKEIACNLTVEEFEREFVKIGGKPYIKDEDWWSIMQHFKQEEGMPLHEVLIGYINGVLCCKQAGKHRKLNRIHKALGVYYSILEE